jgi:hypothetical protein
MHTKSFRLWVKWQILDVGNIVGMAASWNTSVILGVREVEVVIKDFRYEVTTNDAENKSSINVISHTTTIVNLSNQEVQHLEWHFIKIIQENFKLSLADTVIFVGEGVGDVPANTTELPSILNNSVEEAHSKQHFLVGGRLLAAVKVSVVNILVGLDQVGADTRWRLKCHLDRVL